MSNRNVAVSFVLVAIVVAGVAGSRASAQEESSTPPGMPEAPVAPREPTCKKKVSKQVMNAGQVKNVVVADAACLKRWEDYSKDWKSLDFQSPTLGTMKGIPAGTFTMGSPESEEGRGSDEVQHEVSLSKSFWMMEHEVTQGEWMAVMGSNPSSSSSCGPTCPVEQVSWADAVEFAARASARDGVQYRLPTEAEWEFAARGGQSYLYAGSASPEAVGWSRENSGLPEAQVREKFKMMEQNGTRIDPVIEELVRDRKPHPVCEKNRNGYGLCDMSGNVWEWVSDWYGPYPAASGTDPVGVSSGSKRVLRGGSWYNASQSMRVALRNNNIPTLRSSLCGFRLVLPAP